MNKILINIIILKKIKKKCKEKFKNNSIFISFKAGFTHEDL